MNIVYFTAAWFPTAFQRRIIVTAHGETQNMPLGIWSFQANGVNRQTKIPQRSKRLRNEQVMWAYAGLFCITSIAD